MEKERGRVIGRAAQPFKILNIKLKQMKASPMMSRHEVGRLNSLEGDSRQNVCNPHLHAVFTNYFPRKGV